MSDSPFALIQFLADVDDDKIYVSHSAERNGLFILRILSKQTSERVADGVNQIIALGSILQTLAHPNIKPVVSHTQQDAQTALVMPYYEGQSAADFLQLGVPMQPDRVIRIALELADALHAAHTLNLYHGALRPESVILAANGNVLLSEWGSNLILPPNWHTSPFVAPELRDGAAPSSQSDVWSLGAVMYHLLTLQLPGTSEDLARLCPTCPPSIIHLIDRMLDPDPYARPYRIDLVGKTLEHERPPQERSRFLTRRSGAETIPLRAVRFFGRDIELAELHTFLQTPANQIISVCGPAGAGRTSLIIEAANRFFTSVSPHPPDGEWRPEQVYFVHFPPDSRSDHLMLALTMAENMLFEYQLNQLQQVISFLNGRKALLILDDIENFFGGATWLTAIIDAVPQVKILLTSVTPFGLPDEVALTLSGLSLPSNPTDSQAPSVQLFDTIARRRNPDFRLTPDILPQVVTLCRRVGGAPLSIILAAGAVADLDIATLTQYVSNALSVNATSDLNFARIRAVFEFIWLLIAPEEREIITRLSVVRGEISLETAQTLGNATLSQLRALVNKSLLQRVPETGGFNLHPLVHRCAQEWFSASSHSNQIWNDHSAHYLRLLFREGRKIQGAGQVEAARLITTNLDNIRSAWMWAVAKQHFEAIDETGESLYQFLIFSLRLDEGVFWFPPAIRALDETPPTPRRDAIMAGLLFQYALLSRQDIHGAQALESLERGESLNRAAWSLRVNIIALYARGLYELSFGSTLMARAVLEKMLTLALYEYNPRSEMVASLYLGAAQYQRVAQDRIALERGKSLLRRTLELCEQLGDNFVAGAAYLHLGMIHANSKDPLTAIDLLKKGLQAAQKVNNPRTPIPILIYLSELATQQGMHDDARDATQQLIAISQTYNHPWAVASALTSLAQLELLAGRYQEAIDLCQTMFQRLQTDSRAKATRANARCIYAYALCSIGAYNESLEQVTFALDDVGQDDQSQMAEVWVWKAVLTYWARESQEASDVIESVIQDYGSLLSPHHRALLYAGYINCAIRLNRLDSARPYVTEMTDMLHEIVTYDYRGSPLLNLLNPRIFCTLVMVFWLVVTNQEEDARVRMHSIIPLTIQTASPHAMLQTIGVSGILLMKEATQQACTWMQIVIQHPQSTAALRARVAASFEDVKKDISPRIILTATARAKSMSLINALNEIRGLL